MERPIDRVALIVLDSVGCGDAPDADAYGDRGANTLANTARAVGGLELPHLGRLGLGHVTGIAGVPPAPAAGSYGRLTETSAGKDTTTGHWELSGVALEQPFPTYPNGFPAELMAAFEQKIARGTLGNKPASGTAIIDELGDEHVATGKPIVYTSADSVFQIAAHEEIIPIDELYRMCVIARELLDGEHAVGRVIARPFLGRSGAYERTERRRDFSLEPPGRTILDAVSGAGLEVMAVGKIEDIFVNRGITRSNHTGNNMAGVDATIEFLKGGERGLIFTNLVDFDALYGHRLDPKGYAEALEAFDRRLPEILAALRPDDVLIITADHGNDPTSGSTDHSRERAPILIAGDSVRANHDLGVRSSFADVAVTIADLLGVGWSGPGASFAREIAV